MKTISLEKVLHPAPGCSLSLAGCGGGVHLAQLDHPGRLPQTERSHSVSKPTARPGPTWLAGYLSRVARKSASQGSQNIPVQFPLAPTPAQHSQRAGGPPHHSPRSHKHLPTASPTAGHTISACRAPPARRKDCQKSRSRNPSEQAEGSTDRKAGEASWKQCPQGQCYSGSEESLGLPKGHCWGRCRRHRGYAPPALRIIPEHQGLSAGSWRVCHLRSPMGPLLHRTDALLGDRPLHHHHTALLPLEVQDLLSGLAKVRLSHLDPVHWLKDTQVLPTLTWTATKLVQGPSLWWLSLGAGSSPPASPSLSLSLWTRCREEACSTVN